MQGQSINNSTPANGGTTTQTSTEKTIEPRELAHMKRRMDGAYDRMVRLQKRKGELERILDSGVVEIDEAEGDENKTRKATENELTGFRALKKKTEVNLAEAKLEYTTLKRQFRIAYQRDHKSRRKDFNDARLKAKSEGAIPKHTEQITRLLEDDANRVEVLRLHATEGRRKEFREEFDKALEAIDPKLLEEISKVSTVKTKIMVAVMNRLKKSAPKGGNQ